MRVFKTILPRISCLVLLAAACAAPAGEPAARPAAPPVGAPPATSPPTATPPGDAPPATSPQPTTPPAGDTELPLPQLRTPSNAFMQALLEGTLVEADGCLRVDTGDRKGPLLVWQPGYTLHRGGAGLEVRDSGGVVVARVGEKIRTGGGEVPAKAFSADLKTPLPAACGGPYWLMGELVSRPATQ